MPFLPALCLVFVIAKLANLITWSWWLVFAPVWMPLAIVIVISAIIGLLYLFSKGV